MELCTKRAKGDSQDRRPAGATHEILTPKRIAERLGTTERSLRERFAPGQGPPEHRSADNRLTENDFNDIVAGSQRRPRTRVEKDSVDQMKEALMVLLKARRTA